MHWLSLFLVGIYVVGAVCTAAKTRHAHRRLRNVTLIATGVLAVACLLVPTLLVADLTDTIWAPYAEGFAVLMLLVLAAAVLLNIKPVSHVEHPHGILVVGARPDDLELICGDGPACFVDSGHEINALVMSHGARGGHRGIRTGGTVSATQLLGPTDITVHDFTDTHVSTGINEIIRVIEVVINFARPDVIPTHSRNDQHQDHRAMHLATLYVARRYSTILCFESPLVTNNLSARLFVDIGDYMDIKVAAIREHADQSGKPYIDKQKLSGEVFHRREQAKVGYAEGYEVVRALSSQLRSL